MTHFQKNSALEHPRPLAHCCYHWPAVFQPYGCTSATLQLYANTSKRAILEFQSAMAGNWSGAGGGLRVERYRQRGQKQRKRPREEEEEGAARKRGRAQLGAGSAALPGEAAHSGWRP